MDHAGPHGPSAQIGAAIALLELPGAQQAIELNIEEWLARVHAARFSAALLPARTGSVYMRRSGALSRRPWWRNLDYKQFGGLPVFLLGDQAADQLYWAVAQRQATWNTSMVLAPSRQPSNSIASAPLLARGLSLGLSADEAAEHIANSNGDAAAAVGAMLKAAVSQVSLADLGFGSPPVSRAAVPWVLVTLVRFLGGRLPRVATDAAIMLPALGPCLLSRHREPASRSTPPVEVRPRNLECSSELRAARAHKLFDGRRSTYWESDVRDGSKPHWICISGWDVALAEFAIFLKDHDSYSPRRIRVRTQRTRDGRAPGWTSTGTLELSRPATPGWHTLLGADELHGVTAIKIEILENHVNGIDSRISGIRLLSAREGPTPASAREAWATGGSGGRFGWSALAPRSAIRALTTALGAVALCQPAAAARLRAMRGEPELDRAAYGLLLDFLAALPCPLASAELERATRGAAWRGDAPPRDGSSVSQASLVATNCSPSSLPAALVVEGAGSRVANGLYRREGEVNGAPCFKKGRWWVVRCTLPSGHMYWYICDGALIEIDDGDLYRVRDTGRLPPESPPSQWSVAKDGEMPTPRIRHIYESGATVCDPVAPSSSPCTTAISAESSCMATGHSDGRSTMGMPRVLGSITIKRAAPPLREATAPSATTSDENTAPAAAAALRRLQLSQLRSALARCASLRYLVAALRATTASAHTTTPRVALRVRPASGGGEVVTHLWVGDRSRFALAEQLGAAISGGSRGGGAAFGASLLLAAAASYPLVRADCQFGAIEQESAVALARNAGEDQQPETGAALAILGVAIRPNDTEGNSLSFDGARHPDHGVYVELGDDDFHTPTADEASRLAAADLRDMHAMATSKPFAAEPCKASPIPKDSPLSRGGSRYYYFTSSSSACSRRVRGRSTRGSILDSVAEERTVLDALMSDSRCAFARLQEDSCLLQRADGPQANGFAWLLQTVHQLFEHLRSLLLQSAHGLVAEAVLHPATSEKTHALFAKTQPDKDDLASRRVLLHPTSEDLLHRLLLVSGPRTLARVASACVARPGGVERLVCLSQSLLLGQLPPTLGGSLHPPASLLDAPKEPFSLVSGGELLCATRFELVPRGHKPRAESEVSTLFRLGAWLLVRCCAVTGTRGMRDVRAEILPANESMIVELHAETPSSISDIPVPQPLPICIFTEGASQAASVAHSSDLPSQDGSEELGACPSPFQMDFATYELLCALLGTSVRLRSVVPPLPSPADALVALRCLDEAMRASPGVYLNAPSAAANEMSATPLLQLDFSRLPAPPCNPSSLMTLPAKSVRLQAQAAPLLRLLASGSPLGAMVAPKEWLPAGGAAALLQAVYARAPLPTDVLLLALQGYADAEAGAPAIRVDGCSGALGQRCNGTYRRLAAPHNGAAQYRREGGRELIYFDSARQMWKISATGSRQGWAYACAGDLLARGEFKPALIQAQGTPRLAEVLKAVAIDVEGGALPQASSSSARVAVDTPFWSRAQDAELVRVLQSVAKTSNLSPRDVSPKRLSHALALQGGRAARLLGSMTPQAMHGRSRALCELNERAFEFLLPWINLSEVHRPGALANMLAGIKSLLFPEKKMWLFDRLVRATATSEPQPALRFDRRAAGRAVAAALANTRLSCDVTAENGGLAGRQVVSREIGGAHLAGPVSPSRSPSAGSGVLPTTSSSTTTVGTDSTQELEEPPMTMFEQLFRSLVKETSDRSQPPSEDSDAASAAPLPLARLAHNAKAFGVTLVGEGASDVGGPYRQVLEDIVAEVQSAALTLLVPTPNASQSLALDRGKFMLNPAPPSAGTLRRLELLGALIGVTLRTRATLPLELANIVWIALVGSTPSLRAYARVDKSFVELVEQVRDNSHPACPDMDEESFDAVYGDCVSFTMHRSDGLASVELVPGGASVALTYANRKDWCDKVSAYRLHECDVQAAALRSGLAEVVPLEALVLFSAEEIERLVCGEPDWSVDALRARADVHAADSRAVGFLWEVLREMNRDERELFLLFVWGRSRMPAGDTSYRFVVDMQHVRGDPDQHLPLAATCFFQLHLPSYTTKEACREKLLYAIHNCREMDLA